MCYNEKNDLTDGMGRRMKKTLLLFILICALVLVGCDVFAPTGEGTASPSTTASPMRTETPDADSALTEPIPTERETETDTPKTEYFPNETDDSHTKRY